MIVSATHLRQCDSDLKSPISDATSDIGHTSGGFLEVFRLKRYKGKAKRHGLLPNALIAYSLIPHVRLMQTSRGVA